jgi:hypothetical protein
VLHGREHRQRLGQPVAHLVARALDPATRGVVDGRVRGEDRVEASPVQGVHGSRVPGDQVVDLDAVGDGLQIKHGPTLVPNWNTFLRIHGSICSNRQKQQDLLTLLREVVTVTALGSSSGLDHYVIFECSDLPLRRAIEKLLTEVDPASVRVQTHRHPLERENGELA